MNRNTDRNNFLLLVFIILITFLFIHAFAAEPSIKFYRCYKVMDSCTRDDRCFGLIYTGWGCNLACLGIVPSIPPIGWDFADCTPLN